MNQKRKTKKNRIFFYLVVPTKEKRLLYPNDTADIDTSLVLVERRPKYHHFVFRAASRSLLKRFMILFRSNRFLS